MNENSWLCLDVSFLCWRAYHTTGHLSRDGVPTGVLYGFLRSLTGLQEWHETSRLAFCFDGRGPSLRQGLFPGYKANRKDRTPEEQKERKLVAKQIDRLYAEVLPELGYTNVFRTDGYEADDLLARLAEVVDTDPELTAALVSADKDLWQCLSPRVDCWNPVSKKRTTIISLANSVGVTPTEWVRVKAIAGCQTDNIPGIPGIGEKTAIKFVLGKLKRESAAWQKIVDGGRIINYNMPLVGLPFKGTPELSLQHEKALDPARWQKVMERLGFQSLVKATAMPSYQRRGLPFVRQGEKGGLL